MQEPTAQCSTRTHCRCAVLLAVRESRHGFRRRPRTSIRSACQTAEAVHVSTFCPACSRGRCTLLLRPVDVLYIVQVYLAHQAPTDPLLYTALKGYLALKRLLLLFAGRSASSIQMCALGAHAGRRECLWKSEQSQDRAPPRIKLVLTGNS